MLRVALFAALLVVTIVGVSAFNVEVSKKLRRRSLCENPGNRIVRENCLEGNSSDVWDVNGAGDPEIQGFAVATSFNVGTPAGFKISTSASSYYISIFRLGYYSGAGARQIDKFRPHRKPKKQPDCKSDEATGEYSCKHWEISASWLIPKDAVSGVYVARLERDDEMAEADKKKFWRADHSQFQEDILFAMPGGESSQKPKPQPHAYGANGLGKLRNPIKNPRASLIYFIVRDDESKSDVVVQTSDNTWSAYNNEGGRNMYGSMDPANPRPRCYKASLDRPMHTRQIRTMNAFLGTEYPLVRFLEANGFDVSYISGVDTDRYGEKLLPNHKVFVSMGHDEYWSGRQRKNVESARDHGVNLVFLTCNEMYWRVRWEDDYRTMVCYKESQEVTKIDPDKSEWTGTFRDSRRINPLGAKPENAVTGQIFTMNAWRHDPLVVPFEYSHLRQWRNTKLERLRKGQRAIMMRGLLGHELDEDVDNGFRPPNMIHVSRTDIDNAQYIQDHGSTFDSGSATHHMTMYRSESSGALVFASGTCQLSWGLDGFHDGSMGLPAHLQNPADIRLDEDITAPEPAVQQLVLNVLADMGAVAKTTLPHLTVAKPSTDVVAPTCTVESVEPSKDGKHAIAVVRAVDHGGIVAGVEVSFDHSGKWRPAHRLIEEKEVVRHDGRVHLDETWVTHIPLNGRSFDEHLELHLFCRATDDSLNTQAEVGRYSHNEEVNKKRRSASQSISKSDL